MITKYQDSRCEGLQLDSDNLFSGALTAQELTLPVRISITIELNLNPIICDKEAVQTHLCFYSKSYLT